MSTICKQLVFLFLKWATLPFLLIVLVHPNHASAECSRLWQEGPSIPYLVPAYPEENARYWVVSFKNPVDQKLSLNLSGEFPFARFMAYTLYDFDKGVPLRFEGSIQHLEDSKIVPLPNNSNPYIMGADRQVTDRNYEIYIVQGV